MPVLAAAVIVTHVAEHARWMRGLVAVIAGAKVAGSSDYIRRHGSCLDQEMMTGSSNTSGWASRF